MIITIRKLNNQHGDQMSRLNYIFYVRQYKYMIC